MILADPSQGLLKAALGLLEASELLVLAHAYSDDLSTALYYEEASATA
jgi:hypothetical protein